MQKNGGRPQDNTGLERPNPGDSENNCYTEVVDDHCSDQSSRCATLLVISSKPAGYSER